MPDATWEERNAGLWAALDHTREDEFVPRMDALTAELADAGREREALTLALTALAPHLPRYQRSLANYASELS